MAQEYTSVLAVAPMCALAVAEDDGVRLSTRCPPVHTVVVGPCNLTVGGASCRETVVAVPAHTPHRVSDFGSSSAMVAYLDPRRYAFEDAKRLAHSWRGFLPGNDDPRQALEDALALPRPHLDPRVEELLALLQEQDLPIAEAARRVGLSESRATHLVSDHLGGPPRSFRAYYRLTRALRLVTLGGASLTEAAHAAGFTDSAHLSRTGRRLLGVPLKRMLPRTVFATPGS